MCQNIFDTLVEVKKEVVHNLDIYCYCSDETIKRFLPPGVKFLARDPRLDSDSTKGMEIYQEFMKLVDSEVYVLCHATSPYIKKDSIIHGLEGVLSGTYDSAFSCSRIQTFCWYKGRPLNYTLDDVVQTQDIEPVYWETSAFYIFRKGVLEDSRRIGCKPLPVETDYRESVDIDELRDYELALKLL